MRITSLILSLLLIYAPLSMSANPNENELTKQILENMEYNLLSWRNEKIFDRKIKLVNGEGRGKFSIIHADGIAFGDLNNDGKIDAAVLISEQGGASATMDQVAAVINKNGKTFHVASVYLGSHMGIKTFCIKNGNIIIDMASDPHYGPISTEVVTYKLVGTTLVGSPGPSD